MDKVRRTLVLLVATALLGCAADIPGGRLTIAPITASKIFGGEAAFWGKLLERDGCLVAGAGETFTTPIFEPNVMLTPGSKTIRDVRQGVEVPIGRAFRAGTAVLRENGGSWSVADIETFYGMRIPPGCPIDDVIRLHDFKLTGGE